MALATVAAGASWPRTRKVQANMLETCKCPRCGLASEDTLHYFWTCPANKNLKDEDIVKTQSRVQAAAKSKVSSFWCRGIPNLDMYPNVPEPEDDPEVMHSGDFDNFKLADKFYLDGSGGARSSDKRLRRCGWGAVVADLSNINNPLVVAAAFGPLPGPDHTVPRSELYAAVFAMEATDAAEIWLVSDSKYFVDHANAPASRNLFGRNGDLWERY